MRVIAIDGPGGSGKSTVSKALAARLGVARLDTGAMYRVVALVALREGVDLHDGSTLGELAKDMDLEMGEHIRLDGEDVSMQIRTPEIDAAVPLVARQPLVRDELVRRQRAWSDFHGGGVVEGRDIASVVFPDAELKIFLTASASERASRRTRERMADTELEELEVLATRAAIERRDEIDSTRDTSPLVVAKGAVVIDSTGCTVDEVVDKIAAML